MTHKKRSLRFPARKRSSKQEGSVTPFEEGKSNQTPPISNAQDSDLRVFQSSAEQRRVFWRSLLRAIETEPLEDKSVKGASGLVHPSVALGIDHNRKRLIVVSGDPDGRSAALAQADIQIAYKDYNVISARPIAVNLAKTAEALTALFGRADIRFRDLNPLKTTGERAKILLEHRTKHFIDFGLLPAIQALGYAALNLPSAFQDVIIQLSHVQFISTSNTEKNDDMVVLKFGPLVALDPAQIDRQMGICSVPLYDFSLDEAEIFYSGTDNEAVRELLKSHQIFQYFFPAPDHLALGLIDKKASSPSTLLDILSQSPNIGHPFGQSELIPSAVKLDELIDELKDKGLAIEGEIGIELSESGKASRALVKFKPREGLLSKLSNIISIKIDLNLNDLFKP